LADFRTAIKFSGAKQLLKKQSFSNSPVLDFKEKEEGRRKREQGIGNREQGRRNREQGKGKKSKNFRNLNGSRRNLRRLNSGCIPSFTTALSRDGEPDAVPVPDGAELLAERGEEEPDAVPVLVSGVVLGAFQRGELPCVERLWLSP
jgi:hypothetical protein